MKFSDTTNYSGIIQNIDFLLFGKGTTNNTDYSIQDRTREINNAYDEAVAELFKADPNFKWDDTNNTDFPCATTTLTSGLDHYSIPDAALIVHRVRVKDRNGKWVTLTPKHRSELSDTDLASTGVPNKYYKMGSAIFPIPVPDYGVASGVELEFQRAGNYFSTTDTTKEPGFASTFHDFIPVTAALKYAIANGMAEKINILTAEKERIKKSMREHYELRGADEKPKLKIKRGSVRRFGL